MVQAPHTLHVFPEGHICIHLPGESSAVYSLWYEGLLPLRHTPKPLIWAFYGSTVTLYEEMQQTVHYH